MGLTEARTRWWQLSSGVQHVVTTTKSGNTWNIPKQGWGGGSGQPKSRREAPRVKAEAEASVVRGGARVPRPHHPSLFGLHDYALVEFGELRVDVLTPLNVLQLSQQMGLQHVERS